MGEREKKKTKRQMGKEKKKDPKVNSTESSWVVVQKR